MLGKRQYQSLMDSGDCTDGECPQKCLGGDLGSVSSSPTTSRGSRRLFVFKNRAGVWVGGVVVVMKELLSDVVVGFAITV